MTPAGLASLERIAVGIEEQASPRDSERWSARVLAELATLGLLPRRCPLAPEDRKAGRIGLRQVLLGDYRALFVIAVGEVFVLQVKHGRQRSRVTPELVQALREAREGLAAPITGD